MIKTKEDFSILIYYKFFFYLRHFAVHFYVIWCQLNGWLKSVKQYIFISCNSSLVTFWFFFSIFWCLLREGWLGMFTYGLWELRKFVYLLSLGLFNDLFVTVWSSITLQISTNTNHDESHNIDRVGWFWYEKRAQLFTHYWCMCYFRMNYSRE